MRPDDLSDASEQNIPAAKADAIAQAFANQQDYCRANSAPITARVVAAIAAMLPNPESEFARKIAHWPGHPLADALPLRAAAGYHALHIAGSAADLAPLYAGAADIDDGAIIKSVTQRFDAALLPWLDGPPQTNEAGRSSNFMAAMLWLIEQGCPPCFDVMEIGSSAGINLMMDRYHYDLGGVEVGPENSVMQFQPEWRGPPPPRHQPSFAAISGCDIAPIDLRDPQQAARLQAYIWPDHPVRFARLQAAMAAAQIQPPQLIHSDAASFVERQLRRPQTAGTTRVLIHSIVWQYLPDAQQQRIRAAMDAAGSAASADRPLAWISLEANRTLLNHELTVRHWPAAPEPRQLATAHSHGGWIAWQGG